MHAELSIQHGEYPEPAAPAFAETRLVRELRERVRDVRLHRERLLVAGYWCLTRVEREYHGRKAAAQALNVSQNVFDELGKLTGIDDPVEGRKVGGTARTLTGEERAWVEGALRKLTVRVGEVTVAEPSQLPFLTVADMV